MLESILDLINRYIFGPGLTLIVLVCGFYLTVRLGLFRIGKQSKILSALNTKPSSGLSPAKAMCVALAGTLGVGNIAGVASAIYIGGAGSIFWMWVSAAAAITLKYAEVVLAVLHRRYEKGKPRGGAYFYIADKGTKAASICSKVFAALCVVGSLTLGTSLQSNAVAVCFEGQFNISPLIIGIIIGAASLAVISGGLERISKLTANLIPLMSFIYIAMSCFIVFSNLELLGQIVHEIIVSAFDFISLGGGVFGFLTSRALSIGVTRGIVSNEAGCGTAPIAHASADVSHPVIQGIYGMLEVFIDTIVICTLSAFVFLIGEARQVELTPDGMQSAVNCFGHFIPFSGVLLSAAVLVFAFGSIICWFYYGSESLRYLCDKKSARNAYLAVFILSVTIGSFISNGIIWSLSDFAISAMTAVNITAVMLYTPELCRETDNYFLKRDAYFVKSSLAKKPNV